MKKCLIVVLLSCIAAITKAQNYSAITIPRTNATVPANQLCFSLTIDTANVSLPVLTKKKFLGIYISSRTMKKFVHFSEAGAGTVCIVILGSYLGGGHVPPLSNTAISAAPQQKPLFNVSIAKLTF